MELTDFKVLTFDCYGTLIDWESGIWEALQPLLEAGKVKIGREAALEAFARHESAQESATPTMLYSDLLGVVHAHLAEEWGVGKDAARNEAFGQSVPSWPAFGDTAAALAHLKQHYKLVILSNVDRASFKASNRKLGVAFDAIYTAEDIGSYKPDPRNFAYLIEHLESDLGLERGDVLHTAQSLFHDHAPARRAGLARAWIDRRQGQTGPGATMPVADRPPVDFYFPSLADLVAAHKQAISKR
jgi:2-haloacid dehalogenase